uniref:Chromosome partition protein smc n=1 Tax=Dulem virus 39 TaxID=3145757 RepID=A0AAU8B5E0_9CAUD
MDSYLDVLTGKLADGSEPNSVRPHDENGKDLNRDDVVRELVFDIDGTETTVKKVTSQKWVKKRGTTEEVFEGNKTTYVIDGFESSNQKAFAEWQEKIAKADVLLMCSNARPFLNTVQKSTAEARKILEGLAGFSTERFIAENPKYAHITEITKNHKIEDVLKQLRRDLAAQKKVASEAKIKLDYEKAREISVDGGIEISDLELAINALKEQIAELDKQESELDEAVKTYDEASSGVLELKFELSDLERKANAANRRKAYDADMAIQEVELEKDNIEKSLFSLYEQIGIKEIRISRNTDAIQKTRELYRNACSMEFDESETICPHCGQEYPYAKKAELMANFKERKKNNISDLSSEGNSYKKQIDNDKNSIIKLKEEILRLETKKEELEKMLSKLERKRSELPQSIDISDTDEYKDIQSQIAEKEAALNSMNNNSEKRSEIKAERRQLIDEISEKRAVILKYQADTEQKEKNVSTLEEDLRNKNQNVADTEQKIDLLKDFSIEKNRQLAKEINPHFKHFQFEFVEYTQEGNPVETLKLVCGGTSYFDGLNHGDRILTECDLVCGLQELNGLNMPVWLDDVESLDSDRIPKIKQQLILLEKTNDEELKIEEVR